MRKIKITAIVLLSLLLTLGMSQAAFAQSNSANGGTYTYNGSKITDKAGKAIDEAIRGMEPGDDLTIKFTYSNKSDVTTYWYMENKVIETLEQTAKASKDGGYTYRLTNVGPDGSKTDIFNSDAVGGGQKPEGIKQGLKAATDATGDWFFIQELDAGQSGHTELYVALDGESQVNSYMKTKGQLQINYAVEDQPPGETPPVGPKTGDNFALLPALAALTAAALAMLLAILSYRRDRKDGDIA